MKKFFSLVLALVMALSLTTVAWGASANPCTDDPCNHEAKIGDTHYDTLSEALKAVVSGDTVTLLKDIEVSTDWHSTNIGAKFAVPVTIDGNGKTLKLTGKVTEPNYNAVFRFEDTATGKNLTIDASGATKIQRGITSKLSITVENCKLIGNGTGYGVIFGEGAGSAIGNVIATVTGSTFTNWKTGVSDNANGQDAKSVSVTGSTFDNSGVNVSASETVTFTGNTVDDGSVIIHTYTTDSELAVTATGNTLDADEVNKIKAETVTTDTNDFATTAALTAAPGYQVVTTPSGTTVVVPASSITPASSAKSAYYTTDLTALSVYPGCDLTKYTYSLEHYVSGNAVAKTFDQKVIWKTDKVSGAKVIDSVYVVAASAESADLAFVNGSQITYLSDVAGYTGTVSVLPTVDAEDAEKCGDMFVGGDYAAYTDANGKMYVEKAGGAVYNVDGKYVELDEVTAGVDMLFPTVDGIPATPATYTLYIVGHTYDYDAKTVNGDKTVTAVFCEECKANFAFVEGTKADAVKKFGAGNFYDNTVTKLGIADLYVAKTAGAAGSAGTSTDKVTSAATFDAGIAMYVGMSVLAATGSAVVIGKKKD